MTSRTPRPWWVGIVSGMASYIDAAAITGFAAAIVIFREVLSLNESEVGIASGALTASVALGALIGGRLGDRYGRRPVFTATMLLTILAAILLLIAPPFTAVLVGAVLLGLGTGADLPVSLSAISEAATDENRGRLLGLSNLLWAMGVVGNMVVVAIVGDSGMFGARVIFAHIGLVALLVLLGRLTIPESDLWRAARAERRSGHPTVRAENVDVRALFRRRYVIPFLGLMVFYTLTNLVANTNGQFTHYVVVEYGGATVAQVSQVSLMVAPLAIVGFLWFMKIADKPSRFIYFTAGGVLAVIAPLILAVFGVSLPVFAISAVIGFAGQAFAFEGIMKVWAQESFPTLLRTTAQGAVISVARFAAAALAAVTPLLLLVGPTFFFTLLAVVQLVGVGTAWFVFRNRDRHNEFDLERDASSNLDVLR